MDAPFNKVLIANRGEIAVRVIRAARELGIRTVAIYSEADRDSLHVKMADEAFCVGPPEPSRSYLNVERIVDVAERSGCEAVHPGYGFLAEDPRFPEALREAGITFVGPPASVQRLVGHKLDARRFFRSVGVPVVPGTFDPVTPEEAPEVAEEIGYPVLVKPVGGGGGIGMMVARGPEELEACVRKASELASSAFGTGEVYLERYFEVVRHIEVQVLADSRGHVVHLYERECSVQRRFQKIVEETPSPALDEELVERVTGYAVKAAASVGYVNAGTFEFLFDPTERRFYLLEVNSRIQVEHPITEAVTGVDIVKEQFMIAAGEPLGFGQEEVVRRGHAFEARVYAEDPSAGFAPSPGRITELREPAGPWVRVDSGVYQGYEVPPYYDPLLFKVVVWGRTREEARVRMLRALMETRVAGIRANLALHR
ncbi:MAG: acetyl-CoA carboxylase biotin carboxylase subunit, partial [Thermoproteota archaeon]